MRFRTVALAAASLVAAFAFSGCGAGNVVDPAKTEIAVRYDVEEATGVKVENVACPGSVEVRAGNRFTCRVTTASGDEALAELVVVNDRADLHLERLRKP